MIDLTGLRNEQRSVVTTLDRPLFVAAGAGSGKTFTLTRRIAWALCPGSGVGDAPFLDSLDQVLVITFTAAAAGEIKERVRSTLRASGMVDAALQVDSAWIGTIHGMCSRILHREALELGLDPFFQVAAEKDAEALRGEALEEVFAQARDDEAFSALLSSYRPRGGNLDGSDSASSVFGMIDTLVTKAMSSAGGFDDLTWPGGGVDPTHEVDSLARSYQSFIARAKTSSEKGADALMACKCSLGSMESWLAAPPSARTAQTAYDLLDQAVTKPSGTYFKSDEAKEAAAEYVEALRELSLSRAAALREPLMTLAQLVAKRYDQKKRESSLLDNDDLLRLGLSAVRDHPAIRAAYADQFRLVMVDEFQDTSAQQVELVKLLSGPGACRLATVGDAQQSIYRFRGADVEVFRRREAESSDSADAGDVCRLSMNFRSHDDILRFVEATCGRGDLLPGFMDLEACPTRKDGYHAQAVPRVHVELVTATKRRFGRSSLAPKADVCVAAVAAGIADRLAAYVEAGEHQRDMALLLGGMTRAGTYIDALRERGLDCVVTGGSTFSAAPETMVMAALLHTLANPADTQTGLYPVLASDLFHLDANDFCALGTCTQELLDAPTKRTIDRGLRDMTFRPDQPPSKRLVLAHDVISRAWERMATWSVADVVEGVVRESGWLARLEAEGVEGRAVAANVLACVRYIRDLADVAGMGAARAAAEFDAWLAATKVGPASLVGGDADVIRIMTVHASKGLEFPIVAVADACGKPRSSSSDTLLPANVDGRVCLSLKAAPASGARPAPPDPDDVPVDAAHCNTLLDWRLYLESLETAGATAEQARLLYVALTRAREAVVLGLTWTFDAKGKAPADNLGARVVAGLLPDDAPQPGETSVDFGGSAPAVLRRVDLSYGDTKDVMSVDAGGAFPLLEGTCAPTATALVEASGGQDGSTETSGDAEACAPFQLYAACDVTPPATHAWRAREGVFSYSSAHAAEGGHEGGATEGPRAASGARTAALVSAPADDLDGSAPDQAEDTADADRATDLGSAFHQLAQLMIETGSFPDAARVGAVARAWSVGARQRARLDAALLRWRDCDLRRELVGHALVRAEVPFFCQVDSAHGRWLEGAIDALGTDPGSTDALVVDYKTGDADLDADQLRAAHAMQARYYAHVLYLQGYRHVECAFVCVERDAGAGQPVVVRYTFDGDEASSL